jgi:hypothetical protein
MQHAKGKFQQIFEFKEKICVKHATEKLVFQPEI